MANAILASTCACVTPWLALPGGGGGEQGGRGERAGGRGVSTGCTQYRRSRASPGRVQKYRWQSEDGQRENLCCCSQGDGDNRHMWLCWLIKHETGAKPDGLRRRGLTWPDQRMPPPDWKSDSQTVQTVQTAIQTVRQTDRVDRTSPDREEPPGCRGPTTGGVIGWASWGR